MGGQRRRLRSFDRHPIHDAHHHRPHRGVGVFEDLAGAAAFVEDEDRFAGAGADRVEGDDVGACGLEVGVEEVAEQELLARERGVCDGRDTVPATRASFICWPRPG